MHAMPFKVSIPYSHLPVTSKSYTPTYFLPTRGNSPSSLFFPFCWIPLQWHILGGTRDGSATPLPSMVVIDRVHHRPLGLWGKIVSFFSSSPVKTRQTPLLFSPPPENRVSPSSTPKSPRVLVSRLRIFSIRHKTRGEKGRVLLFDRVNILNSCQNW